MILEFKQHVTPHFGYLALSYVVTQLESESCATSVMTHTPTHTSYTLEKTYLALSFKIKYCGRGSALLPQYHGFRSESGPFVANIEYNWRSVEWFHLLV